MTSIYAISGSLMKTTLFIAILCLAKLACLPAHAQPTGSSEKEILETKARAEQGDAAAQANTNYVNRLV